MNAFLSTFFLFNLVFFLIRAWLELADCVTLYESMIHDHWIFIINLYGTMNFCPCSLLKTGQGSRLGPVSFLILSQNLTYRFNPPLLLPFHSLTHPLEHPVYPVFPPIFPFPCSFIGTYLYLFQGSDERVILAHIHSVCGFRQHSCLHYCSNTVLHFPPSVCVCAQEE